MSIPMVVTERIALTAEEHAELGALIRASEASKLECTKYIDKLGQKYALYAHGLDCSVGFDSGFAVISEPQRVLRAS